MMINKSNMHLVKQSIFWMFLSLITYGSIMGQNLDWDPPNSADFSNTSNLIAAIYLNEIKSDNSGDQIAIFVGEEIRGLSTPIPVGNGEFIHFVTLYSNMATEEMDVRVYHQATGLEFDVAEKLEFETGAIYGSIDIPWVMNIYDDNNPPISISNIPDQTTLENYPFGEINLLDYLIQLDNNDVVWTYTPNPNLNVNIENGLLNVEGSSGFSGGTSLTIRATKLPFNTYAETSIKYTITPYYEGPAWNNIPPQGILKGEQFAPLNLHDFEYQYGGPAILYDYLPIILSSKNPEAKPTWTETTSYEVNMNLTLEMFYTPKYKFHHPQDMLAAFIDDEIRGVATRDTSSGLFYLTVGGQPNSSEAISLKFYSGEKKQIFSISNFTNFEPYKIFGKVDLPTPIDLSPLLPDVPNFPIPGGVAAVPIEIVDTSFVGIEHFRFFAFDPMFPEYLRADTATSFCIAESNNELLTLYADFDGDGLGNPNISIQSCEGVLNYVANGDDCDDTNYIECAPDIIVSNDPGVCEATNVSLIEPSFVDCNVTLITNDAPAAFPLGTTLVRWTLEFNETTTKSCSQLVTVIDSEAPIPDIGGTSTSWDEISNILANDSAINQQFGYDVDISNDWAVVGARYDDEAGIEAGAAYIFWYNDSTWIQHSKLLASNGEKNDEFGTAVSIFNNRVVIGAPGQDIGGQEAGVTYVFEYNGSNWIESAILVASNSSDNDGFGGSVSIHADYAAIGSIEEDSVANNSGAVYVFEFKSEWIENAILKANDAQSDDQFGCDVAISGSHVIIGAKHEDSDGTNSGGAYIFERNDDLGMWLQSEKLTVTNPEAESEFGASVDISGNHAIVGSPKNNTNGQDYGVAIVYSKSGNNWVEEQIIQPDSLHPTIEFGTSVSISANYIAIGAPYNLASIPGEGAAYIYRNDNQVWSLQSSVLASNSEIENFFGSAVAIYGHNAIIGAFGVDTPQNESGQSYVFNLNAGLPLNNSPCPVDFDPPLSLDNCDGVIEGILEETSNYIGLGFFEIKWSYTDSSGNTAFQYQMVQTLEDTIPPTISCPSQLTLLLDNSGNLLVELADSSIISNDNCGMLTLDYSPSSFDCSNLGNSIVEVTAEDVMGNQASCQIPVTINEGPKLVKNLSNNSIGSLRMLIEGSCGGAQSIIYFDTTLNGTIQLVVNPIVIDKDIEIVGLGKDIINIDANNAMRIFEIAPMSNVTLRGLQLSNGEEILEGGALINKGTLNLDNIRFIGNRENGIPKAFSSDGLINIIGGIVEVKE